MRLILFILILLAYISCKDGKNQQMPDTAVGTTDSTKVMEEWIKDFKKFRDAVKLNDKTVIKTYFNFPIQGNEIWQLAYWDEEFMPEQEFVDAKEGFKEKDFDERYHNIFNEYFTNALLKINLDKLFKNETDKAIGFGKEISYEIIATVKNNQLKLEYEYNKLHKDPWGNMVDGGVGKVTYIFEIIDGKKIMFIDFR